MSEVPCICGCNSVSICFCDQILVAFVHWHSNFVSSVGVQKIEMITAKESKQAAKGRMQMYQPAQRLARGNAGGYTDLLTQPNMAQVVMKSAENITFTFNCLRVSFRTENGVV